MFELPFGSTTATCSNYIILGYTFARWMIIIIEVMISKFVLPIGGSRLPAVQRLGRLQSGFVLKRTTLLFDNASELLVAFIRSNCSGGPQIFPLIHCILLFSTGYAQSLLV